MATSTASRKTPKVTEPLKSVEVKDPVVEMLDRYGFKYALREVQLADVNRKKSQTNQARISEPINQDQVAIYAIQMLEGDNFPPVVLYRDGTAFVVMDGNHRTEAASEAGIASILAYIVEDPSPAEVQAFTYEANTKHGLPTSLPDRIRQAIFLHEQGVTLREAANRLGIEPNKLAHAVDSYKADERFLKLGIKRFDKLNISAKRKLDAIPNDIVLKAAGELAIEAGLGGDELGKLVRDINAVRAGERAQLKLVQQVRESRATTIKATAGGRVPIPENTKTLARSMTTINRLDMTRLQKSIAALPADARAEYSRSASETVTRMVEILRFIQRANPAG